MLSDRVALVTNTPWAGLSTAARRGSVGSTQWRRQAASTMRPNMKLHSNQSTKSGSSSEFSSMACSMARQAVSIIRARRSSPLNAPSMRARSPAGSSSVSSSRMSSRCRARAISGASSAARAAAAPRAVSRTRSSAGRAAHCWPSSAGPMPRSLVRAASCSSTAVRNTSTGPIGLGSPVGGAMRPDQPSPGRAMAANTASFRAARAPS